MIPKKIRDDLKIIRTQIKTGITWVNNNFPKGSGFLISQILGQLKSAIMKVNTLDLYIQFKNEEEKLET